MRQVMKSSSDKIKVSISIVPMTLVVVVHLYDRPG